MAGAEMVITRHLTGEVQVGTVLVGQHVIPRDWFDGIHNESAKSFRRRLDSGFFATYCAGNTIVDVGYYVGGGVAGRPIFPHAIGVDLDYQGYDGLHLPFVDNSVDTIYASHMLEDALFPVTRLRDWHRVLKIGGFMVIMVPHQYLYEKADHPPSRFNGAHTRFYTPSALLREIELALPPNSWRLRHLRDNDDDYDYDIGPEQHATGSYEIELVIEKILMPRWTLELRG